MGQGPPDSDDSIVRENEPTLVRELPPLPARPAPRAEEPPPRRPAGEASPAPPPPVPELPGRPRSLFRRLLVTFLSVLVTYAALNQLLALRLSADVTASAFQEQMADPTLVAVADSMTLLLTAGASTPQVQAFLDRRYGQYDHVSVGLYSRDGVRLAAHAGQPGAGPGSLSDKTLAQAAKEGAVHRSVGLGFVVVGPVLPPGGTGPPQGFVRFAAQPQASRVVNLVFETTWLWTLPIFLLAALTAFLGTRSITERLREAEAVVQRMARGDESARIPVGQLDEVGQIAITFNRTADQLQRSNAQLKATDETRRRLVADFAHELNTPLTNVLAYLETLIMGEEEGGMDPATRLGFIQVAHDEARRLAHLARDLETVTKLEAGRLKMEQELVDLSRMAVELARRVIPRAEKQGLEVFTDIAPGGEIVGDQMRLEQVGMNLLENALRYTQEGSITVSVRANEAGVRLSVQDTGIGIPKDDVARVMSRFYRVDGSRNRATGGSGLGLAIVGGIVERHSGRVELESELGVGTTVSLWFPREGSVADVAPPVVPD